MLSSSGHHSSDLPFMQPKVRSGLILLKPSVISQASGQLKLILIFCYLLLVLFCVVQLLSQNYSLFIVRFFLDFIPSAMDIVDYGRQTLLQFLGEFAPIYEYTN